MKRLSGVLFVSILFLYSCHSPKKKALKPSTEIEASLSSELHTTNYEDLNGNPVFLNDYKGKKLLLNFWSTRCKPCVEEMYDLEHAKSLLEKNNYSVILVSNESIKEIEDFKSKTNFKLDYIRYKGNLADLNIYALPTTFIFNEMGEKAGKLEGKYKWDTSNTIEKLKEFK
ncbi:TlpA family protein disulfide reductase [Formosa undariae]|uniref:TlpA family protein disulfide reductase n=1 Tax=Formosa undariae TaxID=1325436 RepID=A0ABV5F370_9FLAO